MATTQTQDSTGFFTKLAAERSTASVSGRPASGALAAAASRYDIRDISSAELNVMSSELYNAGVISREEFAMLSFQPEMNRNYDAVGDQGVKRPDPTQQRDALAEWEGILKTQEQFGSSDYFTEKTRAVVALLRRLASLRDHAGSDE